MGRPNRVRLYPSFVTRSISLIVAAALRAAKVAPEVKLPAKSYPAAYLRGTVSLSVS